MVSRLSLLAAVLLLACFMPSSVLADTPANCTYADMLGHWNVFVSAPGDKTINCSIENPTTSAPGITFKYPNIAIDDAGNQGNWTLIYNQGLEVWIAGRIHMAFSAYSANGSQSFCDRTQIGWSHNMDGSNWNCLYAQRSNANDEYDIEAPVAKEAEVTKALDQEQKFVNDVEFLESVNAAQDYFTVKHYPEWEQFTVSQLQRMRGSKNPDGLHASLPPHAVEKKPHHHRRSNKKLPTSWDWRNVSGENFVSPVRDQGQCGSCYAFSSAGMMEARIRIASNNAKQPIISTQEVVSCSQYSQGCEGGFPYLVAGKLARDFGISEESCYPYEGVDSACTPDPQPGCNPNKWFTNEYYYIGGYYGESNPDVMMEEIMTNGPISVSFEVYDDFMSYSGGVYTHQFTKHLSAQFNPFELVNHAVLCVGWGVTDTNVPYWIVKNSWGESWGESGYFRILRGSSEAGGECAIESITVSAIPILQQ